MQTQCPHCGAYFNGIDDSFANQEVRCNSCKKSFTAKNLRSTTSPPFIISNDKAPKKTKKQFTLSGFMSAVGWTFVVLAVACCVMGFVEKQDTSSSFLYLLAIAVICFVLAKVTKDKN